MNQQPHSSMGLGRFRSATSEAEASIQARRRAYEADPENGALAAQLAVELHRLGRPLDPGLESATLWHRFRTDPTNGDSARALLGRLTRDGREVPPELLEALLNHYLSRETLIPNAITGCVRPLITSGRVPDMARVWARLQAWAQDPRQTRAAKNEIAALEPIYRLVVGQ